MTLYKNIEVFEPFFHSIRKHQTFFIIDIKIPETWTFKEHLVELKDVVGFKDNGVKANMRFLSFFSKQIDSDIEMSKQVILNIIKSNQEREEKDRLLQEKIIELKRKFEDADLDSLKSLHFEYSESANESKENDDTKEEVENEQIEGTGLAQ